MSRLLALLALGAMLLIPPTSTPIQAQTSTGDGPAHPIAQVQTATASVSVAGHLTHNDQLFFSANDGRQGYELAVSNGTAAGTRVINLNPGSLSSNPRHFTAFGADVYFVATVQEGMFGASTPYLYRSNGSAAGTTRLATVADDSTQVQAPLVATTNGLFFVGMEPTSGPELWFSDGTSEGTRLVRDLFPGPGGSGITHLTAVGDRVFFAATGADERSGLWVSDGTAIGTTFVSPTTPYGVMVALGDHAYFTRGFAYIDTGLVAWTYTDYELWSSDGTATGTRMLQRFFEPPVTAAVQLITFPEPTPMIRTLTVVGDQLFFAIWRREGGSGLWSFDGSSVHQLSALGVEQIRPAGQTALIRGWTTALGTQLLRSDGTPDGTTTIYADGYFTDVAAVGNEIYITSPNELLHHPGDGTWASLHTFALTQYSDNWLVPFGSDLLFIGNDAAHGAELWRSNGTLAGTQMVIDLNTNQLGTDPTLFTPAGDQLFFFTGNNSASTTPPSLWVTNGPSAAPTQLIELHPTRGGATVEQAAMVEDRLFARIFDSRGGEASGPMRLLVSDGTVAGTRILPIPLSGEFAVLQDRIYFRHYYHNNQLWSSDGTPEGTGLVHDLERSLISIVTQGDHLLISSERYSNLEIWRSDGTANGTVLLKRFADNYGDETVYATPFVIDNGTAFLIMTYQSRIGARNELVRSDGTPEGTSAFATPNAPGRLVELIGAFGDRVLLQAIDEQGRLKTWVHDGSADGNVDLNLPGVQHELRQAHPFNGGIMFIRRLFVTDYNDELWFSDGTPGGTRLLLTLDPYHTIDTINIAHDRAQITVNRYLWSNSDIGQNHVGSELWASDGTAVGTHRVQFFPRGYTIEHAMSVGYATGGLFLNPITAMYGGALWAIADNVALSAPGIVGAEPGALVAIPITVNANHAAVAGDLTVDVQLDPILNRVAPAQLNLTFGDMGYLDERTQFISVRLPADTAYGATVTITATLSGAPTNDPNGDNSVTITVQAAQQLYLPLMRR